MGFMKLGKETKEFQMFEDYWKMLQEHWVVEDQDSYWEEVMSSGKAFSEKYKSEFAKELMFAFFSQLERKSKEVNIKVT